MPMHEGVSRANQMVDDLFEDRDDIPRDEIVGRAREECLPHDVLCYFEWLPPGRYGRDELVVLLNRMIRERERLGAVA